MRTRDEEGARVGETVEKEVQDGEGVTKRGDRSAVTFATISCNCPQLLGGCRHNAWVVQLVRGGFGPRRDRRLDAADDLPRRPDVTSSTTTRTRVPLLQ